MTRQRYGELFNQWKPQQIQEEFWRFIDYLNTQQPIDRFLEIGTAFGTTIPFFAELSKELAITVDIRDLQFPHLTDPKVKYILGDSGKSEIINQIKLLLNGKLFDLIFIDGAHEYEVVKKDYLIYKDLVRPGGMIAFHDIVILDDVRKFWEETRPTLDRFVTFYQPDGYGIGVIIKACQLPTTKVVGL